MRQSRPPLLGRSWQRNFERFGSPNFTATQAQAIVEGPLARLIASLGDDPNLVGWGAYSPTHVFVALRVKDDRARPLRFEGIEVHYEVRGPVQF